MNKIFHFKTHILSKTSSKSITIKQLRQIWLPFNNYEMVIENANKSIYGNQNP
jgi:hypothetical protein